MIVSLFGFGLFNPSIPKSADSIPAPDQAQLSNQSGAVETSETNLENSVQSEEKEAEAANQIAENNIVKPADIALQPELSNPTQIQSQPQSQPQSETVVQTISKTQSNGPAPSEPANKVQYYQVVSVTDGDTFKVNIAGKTETLRLIGINTPETVDPRKPVECFGKEASNRAKQLLIGKKVRLEGDSTQDERDKYGRLLRYAWLEDGTFFNKAMISGGYAYEYTYDTPYKYQAEFKQAQTEAKNNKFGLWADGVCQQIPANTTTVNPATQNGSAPSGHVFYTSSYRTSKYYYCDTDEGWKSLTSEYLKSFQSEKALLEMYPSKTLHEPCS